MLDLTVAAIRCAAEGIKHFQLVPVDGPLPPCEAGAHIEIEIPILDGKQVRHYSLLRCEDHPALYEIAVLKEANGRGGSRYMHDFVREGEVLRCSIPKNQFPLCANAPGHLLIAGGIGITPIFAMVQSLAQQSGCFELFYAARSERKVAFRHEVADLCGDRVTFVIDGGDPSRGLPLERIMAGLADDWHIYVCGPKGMIDATRSIAMTAGIGEHRIHSELFSASPAMTGNKPFKVIAQHSGIAAEVRGDESLLDALIRAGIDAPHDCKRGECGTCCIGVTAGTVDHRDYYLNGRERASNKLICTCVSRALSDELVLEI